MTTLPDSSVSMTSSLERPLRADAERNRRRILAAAADLFAQRGLDVGLDEIARHAGVGTGTVYRRFPDKAMLIEALFEHLVEHLVELAEEACEHPDPWSGLVMFLEGMVARQQANRGLKQLLFGTCPSASIPDKRVQIAAVLERLIGRAQASGQLRPDVEAGDVALIQVMVSSAGDFTAEHRPDQWRRQLGLILDGLRITRTAPTPLAEPALTMPELEQICGIPVTSGTGQTLGTDGAPERPELHEA